MRYLCLCVCVCVCEVLYVSESICSMHFSLPHKSKYVVCVCVCVCVCECVCVCVYVCMYTPYTDHPS